MGNLLKKINERIKKTRGTVLLRWFFSYLAILSIPLIFSITVYFYSLNIINKNLQEIYNNSLEQFRIEMDNFFNSSIQSLQQLALNSDIQVLALVDKNLELRHRWNIFQTIKAVRNMHLILPLIDEIFVVFGSLDSVITSSTYMPINLFYHLNFENNIIDEDEFTRMLTMPGKNEIISVGNKLLFFQSDIVSLLSNSSVTFGLSFDKESFNLRFFNSYEATGGKIFILSQNGNYIYSTGNQNEIPVFSGNRGFINDVSYKVLSLDSRIMNWKYLYLIPESLEMARARQIQIFTFIGLFFCTILSLFFSFLMTKHNYDPVRKLIAVFKRSDELPFIDSNFTEEKNNTEDEFLWMEKRAMDTQRNLNDNAKILRKYYIQTLLEKPFDPINGKNEMNRYRIKLEGDMNLVAIFSIPGFQFSNKILSEKEIGLIDSFHYVINQIFNEINDKSFSVEICDTGEYCSVILNWSGDIEPFIVKLEEIIEYTQQKAGNLLNSPVVTALGNPRQGIEGIYYSNLEAIETLRYLDLNTSQSILHYQDIGYLGNRYRFSQETEQKLINLCRIGDDKAVIDLLRQIWAENMKLQNYQGKMIKLLSYNILGSLVKGMEQDQNLDNIFPANFNFENISYTELTCIMENAAKEICRNNLLFNQDNRINHLGNKVKKFIEENYKNPDINISITSLHFKMNPVYLSGVFKEKTGLNLLEYINTLRIEESKKLLRSGLDVNEAAKNSGFRGTGTFIRIFKKMTGVTPGQFRELEYQPEKMNTKI